MSITITGSNAIDFVIEADAGLLLSKHSDPIEDGRDDLTIDEARDIAAEDEGLIYITVDDASVCEVVYALAESYRARD